MTDPSSPAPVGALAGLRVLELGTLIAGPFCGQLLGDMGAEVIKIEAPGQGDPMRTWGPQPRGTPSVWWPVIGRNKKGVTLDLRQAEGQSLFKDLVRKADVVIENFRPGTLEKWSCGWKELSTINPRLILVRVSGYGQTGPLSDTAWCDLAQNALTSIDQSGQVLGLQAARLLIERIKGRESPEHFVVTPRLVARGSSRGPKSA